MKRLTITLILAVFLASTTGWAGMAADPTAGLMDKSGPLVGRQQTACPIQGGKINKNLYADYQSQRVYFCCPECLPIFKKNPEAYLKRMERQGVTPEKVPAAN
jgi:YHS domain-containing protein